MDGCQMAFMMKSIIYTDPRSSSNQAGGIVCSYSLTDSNQIMDNSWTVVGLDWVWINLHFP
jgi:hypothetical protein